MKRKILTVLAILLGLAGLGVLLYPSVSNWMEQAKPVSYTHLTLPTNSLV